MPARLPVPGTSIEGTRQGRRGSGDQLPAGTGEEDLVVAHARRALARAFATALAVVPALCLVIDGGAKRW